MRSRFKGERELSKVVTATVATKEETRDELINRLMAERVDCQRQIADTEAAYKDELAQLRGKLAAKESQLRELVRPRSRTPVEDAV